MNFLQNLPDFTIGDGLPHGHFELHSRFKRVVNFVNESKEIVFLTTAPDVLSSNGIYIKNIILSDVDYVDIEDDSICLNQQEFSRNQFSNFDSSFNYDGVIHEDFESALSKLIFENSHLLPEKSLFFLIFPEREKLFDSGFDLHLMKNAKEAADCILENNIIEGVKRINGTGFGLTPSGSDFVAGLLLGLHYLGEIYKIDLENLKSRILDVSLGQNLLVNTFLINARRGAHFFSLKKTLYLLVRNLDSFDAFARLISYGSTSGADLLSGYFFTIKHRVGL